MCARHNFCLGVSSICARLVFICSPVNTKCAMKTCSRCKADKPSDEFARKGKRGGPGSRCRSCTLEVLKEWKAAHPGWEKVRHCRRRDKRRELIINYFKMNPCVDCGNKDFRVLEFDHVKERGQKSFTISRLSKNAGIETLNKEIAKCEIRCANCHRLKTAERDPKHWSHRYPELFVAGSPGVEPRQGESKSPVLPLHHEPIRRGRTPGVQLLLI